MGGARLLAPGTRLGSYRVEAFLARGSTGEVYRATDERLGRAVALKVLPAWLEEDATARDRFLAEARAAAALDHPNVLPVHDAGDEDGTLWIAMRLAEGRDLRELLRREGPLAPGRAVAILAGVAAALDAAHARGILHRDVKPGNILLGADDTGGHPYLADFGLATAAHGRGLTRTGEILGTIDYVSPEQARGEALDARSDVYSLAAVLFECLAGEAPFHRESELAALTARLDAPAPSVSSLRPDLPEALDAVLARGLARDPADRYASAGALMAAARAAVEGAQLRGLLFADLRGYTAFAEREGDARAATLLDRYRRLVRAAVARAGGRRSAPRATRSTSSSPRRRRRSGPGSRSSRPSRRRPRPTPRCPSAPASASTPASRSQRRRDRSGAPSTLPRGSARSRRRARSSCRGRRATLPAARATSPSPRAAPDR